MRKPTLFFWIQGSIQSLPCRFHPSMSKPMATILLKNHTPIIGLHHQKVDLR
jgi:hypothetical protein